MKQGLTPEWWLVMVDEHRAIAAFPSEHAAWEYMQRNAMSWAPEPHIKRAHVLPGERTRRPKARAAPGGDSRGGS